MLPVDLAAWVAAYAAEASAEENVDEFVSYVDRSILELIPELAQDPVLVRELHASTRSQFRAFLNLLDREQQEVLLPPQATDFAVSIARRNLELGVLLKVYRVAQASVWEFFTHVADSVPDGGPDRADVLVYLWGRAGSWINQAIEQLITEYYAEREATLHGVLARRSNAVHALLRGDVVSLDTATAELGHKMRAHQTCLVLWAARLPQDGRVAPLDAFATAVAARLGSARPLTMPVGRTEVWAWLATTREPTRDALEEAIEAAAAKAGPDHGVQVAVGGTGRELAGFRESHREAVAAQRTALAGLSLPAVTFFADVELVSILSGNEEAARSLVRRELGGLVGADPALERVRQTLRCYLQSGGIVDPVASALVVHKNTVRYRLAQAEELIGHSLDERRTEMDLALRYLQHRPDLAD